jgi:flagellar hook assembly protein FlgD
MKYLTIVFLLCLSLHTSAQYMVIHINGTEQQIALSDISKLTFDLSDNTGNIVSLPEQTIAKMKMAVAHIFPNPFTPRVEYSVRAPSRVSVKVFDMMGKKIRTVHYGTMQPGNYSVNWDLRNDSGDKVTDGPYIISVRVGTETVSKNLFIIQ